MIVQPRVLIVTKADTMLCARRTRQESCSGSTMQIVNHVVARGAKLTRYPSARRVAVTRDRDYLIDQLRAVEDWRHPVLQKDVDLRQEGGEGHLLLMVEVRRRATTGQRDHSGERRCRGGDTSSVPVQHVRQR